MSRKEELWNFVRLGGKCDPEVYDGKRYRYKFRLNLPYGVFKQKRQHIADELSALIASDSKYSRVIHTFKTPTEAMVAKQQKKDNPNYVDSGQFTIYAKVGGCSQNLVLGFSEALQELVSTLGVAAVAPLPRDRALTANVSLRADVVAYWLRGAQVVQKFSSRNIRDSADLLQCYKIVMADTKLYQALDDRLVRDAEGDNIHQILLHCYSNLERTGSRAWLSAAKILQQCRALKLKILRGKPFTSGDGGIMDLVTEHSKNLFQDGMHQRMFDGVVRSLRSPLVRVSAMSSRRELKQPPAGKVPADAAKVEVSVKEASLVSR